jgi:hypothetical protein
LTTFCDRARVSQRSRSTSVRIRSGGAWHRNRKTIHGCGSSKICVGRTLLSDKTPATTGFYPERSRRTPTHVGTAALGCPVERSSTDGKSPSAPVGLNLRCLGGVSERFCSREPPCRNPERSLRRISCAKGKSQIDFSTWLLFMPATTYSPTHFRVQYHRPGGA